jgi:hypothetical protein
VANQNQILVTDYYGIIDKLDKLLYLEKENKSLILSFNHMKEQLNSLQKHYNGDTGPSLLNKMMAQSIKQHGKHPKKFQHRDPTLQHFFLNVWILGGRKLYEIFNANFPEIFPSPTTIERRLLQFDKSVDEGSLNIGVLKDYLSTNNLPLVVCLSEDATALVGRRQYHPKTNRVVGFSVPLPNNGLPDVSVSIARTASDIIKQFRKYNRATSVLHHNLFLFFS